MHCGLCIHKFDSFMCGCLCSVSCGCVAGGLAVAKGTAAPSSAPIGCLPACLLTWGTLRLLLLLLLCCSRWSVQLDFLTFHCIANDGKFRVFAAHAHKAWFCHNYVVDGANKFCMLFACGFNRKSLTPNTSLHYPYIVHSWESSQRERVREGSWREFWYNQKPK